MEWFFDCHCDILYDLAEHRDEADRFERVHVRDYRQSCVGGAIWAMYSPDEFDLVEACSFAISRLKPELLPGFKVILGLEGLRNLKSVEALDEIYALGFRHAMLTWNEANHFATGAKADPERGLTAEGARLIKRMEELGMIIDLAHTNKKTFYDILKIANKRIMFSHGNVSELCDHPRNVDTEQMLALKKVDGVLGLTFAKSFIKQSGEPTLADFMEHLRFAVKVMGVDNVCFGFDFMNYLTGWEDATLPEVNSVTKVGALLKALHDEGFSQAEIDKMTHKNVMDRFGDLLWDGTTGKN